VVYLADEDRDNARELYAANLGGGEHAKLSRPLPPGWEVQTTAEGDGPARILPDASRVLYEIGTVVGDRVFRELYSVGIQGGASARLDYPPLIPDGEIHTVRYQISADSRRVVYELADQHLGEPRRAASSLISVPAAGPASAGRLLAGPQTDGWVFQLSRDSRRVGFLAPENDELLSVPIGGGDPVALTGAELPTGFLRAGDGHFAYDALVGGLRRALFSAPVDGGGQPRDLTVTLGEDVDVFGRALTPDGSTVIYLAHRFQTGQVKLYSSRLAP
jgi:hypothetical protein